MSGHSKWATIHRQKEVNDSRRGAIFTKLAQMITLAARQGKGLALAVEKAKQANMPKENIQRAIDRGLGGGEADNLAEVLYEGFGPGGIGILISAITDNKLRTAQQVREVLDKNGGTMGNSGSVSYLFSHKGEIVIRTAKPAEEAELEIIDLGVDDIESLEGGLVIYCDKDRTFELKDVLEKHGFQIESADLVMKPMILVEVPDSQDVQKIEAILTKLEDLDDVHRVWSNLNYA